MLKFVPITFSILILSVSDCRIQSLEGKKIAGVSALITLTDAGGNLLDEYSFSDPDAQGSYGPVDLGPDIYTLRAGQKSQKNPLHLETFFFATLQNCVTGPERYDLAEPQCKGQFQYCEDLVSWEDSRCLDEQWSLIALEKGSHVEVKKTSKLSEGRIDYGDFQFILLYPDGRIRKIIGEYKALMKHPPLPQ